MFERFTSDARQVVVRARQEAVELGHPFVGTEHLLLAMLAEAGSAGNVLREAGLDPSATRESLLRITAQTQPLIDAGDAEALRSVGIDVEAVLARIQESFGPQALVPPAAVKRRWFARRSESCEQPWRQGTFAARSKKVLELSLREALRMEDREIHSGHILLGLLREGEGLGAKLLVDAGLDLATLKFSTEQHLHHAA